MTDREKVLIEIIKVNQKDIAVQFLQSYIQQNGFLSNEAGDIIKKILEEKN